MRGNLWTIQGGRLGEASGIWLHHLGVKAWGSLQQYRDERLGRPWEDMVAKVGGSLGMYSRIIPPLGIRLLLFTKQLVSGSRPDSQ